MLLLGVDFTSSPSRRKPIVLALGERRGALVRLSEFVRIDSLEGFSHWLQQERNWLGAFDLPFGLPRALVQALGWPLQWRACIEHYAGQSRAEVRASFAAYCAARPVGHKFAHRATDGPAGSSPSMKWVNPPVALMLHAAMPLLLQAGVHLPGLCAGDARRVALEAYPGLLVRELVGRASYKSDERARQTPERAAVRARIVQALQQGRTRLGLRLRLLPAQQALLLQDASGDHLDAAACLVQAAWAERARAQGSALYGLPPQLDPLEGWILTAPWPSGP
ncbi:DUF429 domain-containing protein [Comamonas sp. NLF-1-9]|uniref:DUF429 domain-containing protein n=1 Tax=Comamonas sp. NLF-1-9 TaxID=2853163 RepID=UPI001C46B4F7|nr:DUF429 domain-containing protein [Comamonas sp. NLF-1-9]QXL85586.1 DUF429 domain-containing protein [Comamonas sp. NLF-1-9]